ncbi:unnamed protein product [Amaranthus hypochondriacus]
MSYWPLGRAAATMCAYWWLRGEKWVTTGDCFLDYFVICCCGFASLEGPSYHGAAATARMLQFSCCNGCRHCCVAAVLVERLMAVGQLLFVDRLIDDMCLDCLDDGLAQLDVAQHFSTLGP